MEDYELRGITNDDFTPTVTQEAPPLSITDERTRTEYYRQFEDLNRADPKVKNIRQTELLVNLRQAILAVSIFICPKIMNCSTRIVLNGSIRYKYTYI